MARRVRGARRMRDWAGGYFTGTLNGTSPASHSLIPPLWGTDRAPTEPTLIRIRGVISFASETNPTGGNTGWGGRVFAAIYGPKPPVSNAVNTSGAMGSEHLIWHDQICMIGGALDLGSPTTAWSAYIQHDVKMYIDTRAKRKFRWVTDDTGGDELVLRLQPDVGSSPDGLRYWCSIRMLWLL